MDEIEKNFQLGLAEYKKNQIVKLNWVEFIKECNLEPRKEDLHFSFSFPVILSKKSYDYFKIVVGGFHVSEAELAFHVLDYFKKELEKICKKVLVKSNDSVKNFVFDVFICSYRIKGFSIQIIEIYDGDNPYGDKFFLDDSIAKYSAPVSLSKNYPSPPHISRSKSFWYGFGLNKGAAFALMMLIVLIGAALIIIIGLLSLLFGDG